MISVCNLNYQSMCDMMDNTIETGFIDYDKTYYDLKPGEITICFSRDGEGKSTVASQILAHHINRGKRAYLFSGELSNNKIQEWLYKQVVGADKKRYRIVNTKYGAIRELKPEVIKALKKWHEARLFIFDTKQDNHDGSGIFDDIENAAKIGVDLIIIDNLMTAFDSNATSQHSDQSNFVQRCKNLARNLNIHIIIIAHANKSTGELEIGAEYGNLTKNDISGIKNISNKADNIWSIERIFKTNMTSQDESLQGGYDMLFTSLKDRWIGQRKTIGYYFHQSTLRFYNNNTPNTIKYDWERFLDD